MQIEETTYSLNIRVLGTSDSDARVQVESLEPMTQEEFWSFLIRASKAGQLPKTTRPSRVVWRDTKESPQPKSRLKEMDEFNQMYKKFKRKFPQASHELLVEKTQQYLDQRKTIMEDFQAALRAQLFGKPQAQGTSPQAGTEAQDKGPSDLDGSLPFANHTTPSQENPNA